MSLGTTERDRKCNVFCLCTMTKLANKREKKAVVGEKRKTLRNIQKTITFFKKVFLLVSVGY